jgi:hypothetical protein
MKYGYGPFEQPVDTAPEVGRAAPRWALWIPLITVSAWVVGELIGLSHPALAWAALTALTLGGISVLVACVGHLAVKLWKR